jgi:uncharacterized protein
MNSNDTPGGPTSESSPHDNDVPEEMREFPSEPVSASAGAPEADAREADAPAAATASDITVATAAPVSAQDRIQTLDLLRGFAVLGILLVNIWVYALPFPAALNPRLVGFDSVSDRIVSLFVHLFAYTKTMPIFSMLFGAGIVLFASRLAARGLKPARFFVRRQLWLLFFGLAHAYLLWNGDILVPYAVIGLILYRLRRRRPRTLVLLAVLAMLVPKITVQVGGIYMEKMQVEGQAAEQALAAGDSLSADQEVALERWREQGPMWNPTATDIDELAAIMRGSYVGILTHNAPETAMMHLFLYPMIAGWNIAGYMLLGMMLFKTGVLKGERSARFYAWMALGCYGLGLPSALYCLWYYDTHHENFIHILRFGMPLVSVSGPLVALGHIALIILAWQRGWLGKLQSWLSAAGRMAFTNYISQTLICTTLFYGYGLGLFAGLNRLSLLGVVIGIWILQLWWSPWWLNRFRFGPLEWLWRSLTYNRRQPFRMNLTDRLNHD